MKPFATARNHPFLMYDQIGSAPNTIRLKAEVLPLSAPPDFESLFKTVDIKHLDVYSDRKIRAAHVIANRVGFDTKRSIANILWVPDTETEMYYQHCNLHWCKQIVVDYTMKPNELRCTYWVINNGLIDGGIQFSPQGFSRLPNAECYFQRCFL